MAKQILEGESARKALEQVVNKLLLDLVKILCLLQTQLKSH